jgi:GalNAc5-diNAcBac-PP-undecaprenol beta-1,3-glucosyltransferase
MTALAATVLIPTHDHSELLPYAARSALRQTVTDLELLIVGDGVPDATREAVAELVDGDERVRFYDLPKGERNGEAYRDAILREAGGSVVCYLSDDDLCLPSHVETMLGVLDDADFASATTLRYDGQGELEVLVHDPAVPFYRELLLSGVNRIPLSAAAHTMAMYHRLPHGWRTTPAGIPTDLYMWQQFLAEDSCRAVSAMTPTVLNFPSSARGGWSPARRAAELERWSEWIASPGWEDRAAAELLDAVVRAQSGEWARQHEGLLEQHREAAARGRRVEELRRDVERLKRTRDERREKFAELRATLRHKREERRAAETKVRRTRSELERARSERAGSLGTRVRRFVRLRSRARRAARRVWPGPGAAARRTR